MALTWSVQTPCFIAFSGFEALISAELEGLDAQNSSLEAIFGPNVPKTRVLRPSMILLFNLLKSRVSKPVVFKPLWGSKALISAELEAWMLRTRVWEAIFGPYLPKTRVLKLPMILVFAMALN